jgi:hypothetical protein
MQKILSPKQKWIEARDKKIVDLFNEMQGSISAIVDTISKKANCGKTTVRNTLKKEGLIGNSAGTLKQAK